MKENDAMTKDSRSSTHSKVLDAPLPVRVPAMAEAFDAVQVSVERFCLSAGIEALQEMMAGDVAALCGPMHRRDRERKAYRWGTTVRELGYPGGKVKVRRRARAISCGTGRST